MQFSESGGNVVALAQVRCDMRFPVIGSVMAYWEGLRMGRLLPLRSEVDPRGIENALEYAFILERIAPQMARFRLAGTHLNALMGMEVRGMPLTAFFTPAARAGMAAEIEAVFQGPQVADFSLTGEAGMGKPTLDARLLILPLRSDLGDVTRALGCLVSDGQIGRTPRRFDLSHVRMSRIEAGRPVTAAPPAVAAVPSVPVAGVTHGLAEAAEAYRAGPPAAGASRSRAAPHLRLVRSQD